MRVNLNMLDEWFRLGSGLLSRAQLMEHGLNDYQIEDFVESGKFVIVRRGVYRMPGTGIAWPLDLKAALLQAGPHAFASHRSAIHLWGFRVLVNRELEITVPQSASARLGGGVTVHRTKLPDILISELNGIAVTSPERTLLELSRFKSDFALRRVLEDALIRKIVSLDKLELAYRTMRAQGRRRFRAWTRILSDIVPQTARLDSDLELRALKSWKHAGVPDPVPQYRIILDGREKFLDFAYPELRIAIELDGPDAHLVLRFKEDRKRDRQLELLGWTVLRFPWDATEAELVGDVGRALRLKQSA